MPITVSCPNCGHTVKAPDNAGGKKGKCPRCGGIVPIPDMPEILDEEEEDLHFPQVAASPAPLVRSAPASGFAPVHVNTADDDLPRAKSPVPEGVVAMVVGKPANLWGYRASFGRTTLSLTNSRIIETTRRPIEERDSQSLLIDVDSVEMTAKGNPSWIAFGFFLTGGVAITPFILILSAACFVLYFFLKHRFLIVRTQSNHYVVGVKGDERPFREFMARTLAEVERLKSSY